MLTPLNAKRDFEIIIKRVSGLIQQGFLKYGKSLVMAVLLLSGAASVSYAMAPPAGGEGGPQGIGAMVQSFLPLILIFVIFYFLLIRPQSKKAKEHKEILENLKKGDKIMTSGGIYGLIDDIDGDTLTIKVGIGADVKIKMNRSHVAGLRTKE